MNMDPSRCAYCGLVRSFVVDGRCGPCGAPAVAPETTELARLRAELTSLKRENHELKHETQRLWNKCQRQRENLTNLGHVMMAHRTEAIEARIKVAELRAENERLKVLVASGGPHA